MSSVNSERNNLLQVKKVKQISFSIDEAAYIDSEINSNIQIHYKSHTDFEKNAYLFTLRITYSYPGSDRIFMQSEVQNIFEIKDLKNLPWDTLKEIVAISISHVRAFMSTNVAGTIFSDVVLPIFDTEQVTRQLFKNEFEAQSRLAK